jgi:hypothetical protein
VIEAIWNGYSTRPFVGNELRYSDIIRTLSTHRFPEAIPLMARFVNSGFMQEAARQFLVEMTGIDLGGDERRWLEWYEFHKGRLGARKSAPDTVFPRTGHRFSHVGSATGNREGDAAGRPLGSLFTFQSKPKPSRTLL